MLHLVSRIEPGGSEARGGVVIGLMGKELLEEKRKGVGREERRGNRGRNTYITRNGAVKVGGWSIKEDYAGGWGGFWEGKKRGAVGRGKKKWRAANRPRKRGGGDV